METRVDRVRFGSGQSGLRVKQVVGQNGSFLNGSIESRVALGHESGQVDPYFSNNFYFYLKKNIDAICQLFMT